jgi:hypothetical protein
VLFSSFEQFSIIYSFKGYMKTAGFHRISRDMLSEWMQLNERASIVNDPGDLFSADANADF